MYYCKCIFCSVEAFARLRFKPLAAFGTALPLFFLAVQFPFLFLCFSPLSVLPSKHLLVSLLLSFNIYTLIQPPLSLSPLVSSSDRRAVAISARFEI